MKVLNSYIIEINCKQMYPQDQARMFTGVKKRKGGV